MKRGNPQAAKLDGTMTNTSAPEPRERSWGKPIYEGDRP